jgi:hypothetical protein
MDNPETMATLGWKIHRTKTSKSREHNTENEKRGATRTQQENGGVG